ncbi:hypothetical protein J3B00_002197 [Pseudomonas sp. BP8]|nr:hypothetical protein [Pseudomonas sp. BP8]
MLRRLEDCLCISLFHAWLFFLEKSNQKPLAPASGPYAALRGSLAPVLLREDRAVRPILGLSAFRPSMASTSLRKTSTRPPEVAGRSRARSRATAKATAGESLRSRFVCLPAELWRGWAGLRPALCIGSTGLFAGQARSYRGCAEFKICAIPVGAGLPREEARISTTPATIEDNASPDATRNFATSGGRVEVLRREVEAMDGRKALRPRMGRTARSSRSKTGARGPVAQRRAGCRSKRFLVTFFQEKK